MKYRIIETHNAQVRNASTHGFRAWFVYANGDAFLGPLEALRKIAGRVKLPPRICVQEWPSGVIVATAEDEPISADSFPPASLGDVLIRRGFDLRKPLPKSIIDSITDSVLDQRAPQDDYSIPEDKYAGLPGHGAG